MSPLVLGSLLGLILCAVGYVAYATLVVRVRESLSRTTVSMVRVTGDNEQTTIAFNETDPERLRDRVLTAGAVLQARMEAHNHRLLEHNQEIKRRQAELGLADQKALQERRRLSIVTSDEVAGKGH